MKSNLLVCLVLAGSAIAHSQPIDLNQILTPATSMQEARRRAPELAGMTDTQAIHYLHDTYYPDYTVEKLAQILGVKLWHPAVLGPIDRWRFESCMSEAARAPTTVGVVHGEQSCRRQFDQSEPD